MLPDVLHLILCDEVRPDANNFHRLNITGLLTSIRSARTPSVPVVHPSMSVLMLWMGGDEKGALSLRIVADGTSAVVYQMPPRQVRFIGPADSVGGAVFRIQNCSFPAGGLYWVEVLFAGSVIARQRLFVRA